MCVLVLKSKNAFPNLKTDALTNYDSSGVFLKHPSGVAKNLTPESWHVINFSEIFNSNFLISWFDLGIDLQVLPTSWSKIFKLVKLKLRLAQFWKMLGDLHLDLPSAFAISFSTAVWCLVIRSPHSSSETTRQTRENVAWDSRCNARPCSVMPWSG